MKHFIIGLPFAFAAAGCGGGDSGGTCGRVEPCGGDVVGTWTISGGCIDHSTSMQLAIDEGLTDVCATSTVSNEHYDVSGELSFNTDLTYGASYVEMFRFNWNIPTPCLQGATCAAFNAAFQTSLQQNPDPNVQSVTCAGSSTCVCVFLGAPQPHAETGPYTTSGTTLVTTASDGTVSPGEYCVQGDAIHFVTVDTTMNTGPMGQATITSDVTATRAR